MSAKIEITRTRGSKQQHDIRVRLYKWTESTGKFGWVTNETRTISDKTSFTSAKTYSYDWLWYVRLEYKWEGKWRTGATTKYDTAYNQYSKYYRGPKP